MNATKREPSATATETSSHSRRAKLIAVLFIAIAATTVVAPMFFLGNASGHDFEFHVASWLDVVGQWREGILYPRWAEWANWGYGEPRFIFYPPASWILGGVLCSILPNAAAPVAFIWLALTAGGLAMWSLARNWLSSNEAIAAGVFFLANPYNILLVYDRSDFSELLAVAFFPLLLLAALRVKRAGWRNVPFLAAVFAAIWLSNAPAAVIATYSLALLVMVAAIQSRNIRPLVVGGTSMLAGWGLAAFYIVPATWEQRWVQIQQAITDDMRPNRNFIYTWGGSPEFVLFNWKVSTLAVGLILLTAILCVLTARRRSGFPQLWPMLVALGLASTFLMFSPSAIFWRVLPKLQFVQFPWRWLGALSVVFAFCAAAAPGPSRRRPILWMIVLVILAATTTAIANDTWWHTDDVASLTDQVQSGIGYDGTDEYAPLGCDRGSLPGVPRANSDEPVPPDEPIPRFAAVDPETGTALKTDAEVSVKVWTAMHRVLSEKNSREMALALRLINYPAWSAEVDGRNATIHQLPDTAQVVLELPPGAHQIELVFRRTTDRGVGDLISIISLISLLGFAASAAKRSRQPVLP